MKRFFFVFLGLAISQNIFATEVGAKALKLQALMGKYAHNDSYRVTSTNPLSMVKQYIFAKNAGDKELAQGYRWVSNSSKLTSDEQVAGTLLYRSAKSEFKGIEGLSEKQATFAQELITEIHNLGGSFGFDGFEQNGCAAPTFFLLILDVEGKKVYGIDLSPCTES